MHSIHIYKNFETEEEQSIEVDSHHTDDELRDSIARDELEAKIFDGSVDEWYLHDVLMAEET